MAYDFVEFKKYNGESSTVETIGRVVCHDDKITFEGKQADLIKHEVHAKRALRPFMKLHGHELLTRLHIVFNGSYFWATGVKSSL